MRRDVFKAIADPVRREIISVIAEGTYTLNTVAENFNISRPAISKHMKILTECGLVTIRQQGRERYCEAKLEKLNEVSQWVERYRIFWTKKLDALAVFLESETPAATVTPFVTSSTKKEVKKAPVEKAVRKKQMKKQLKQK